MKNKISLDDPEYNMNQSNQAQEAQITTRDRASSKMWIIIAAVFIISVGLCLIVFNQDGGSDNSDTGTEVYQESCSIWGTADVYPTLHMREYVSSDAEAFCSKDGDGYYYPGIGHHHHYKN